MQQPAPSPRQHRRGLINQWQMLSTDAEDFVKLLAGLSELRRVFVKAAATAPRTTALALEPDAIDAITKMAEEVEGLARGLNAKTTVHAATDLKNGIRNPMPFQDLDKHVVDITTSLQRDFTGVVFYAVEFRDLDYFAGPTGEFLDVLDQHFPGAAFNFVEAGRCIALDRPTASVMHIARALEPTLAKLATALGITCKPKDPWGEVLRLIQVEFDIRDKGKPRQWASAEEKTKYHDAAKHFRSIKEAIRDPAFHNASLKFTPEEARHHYDSARLFMGHVAKIVS